MAIYHLSMSALPRSAGRSAASAAAYRAGEKILDPRTGEIHDYSRRSGVVEKQLILPGGQQVSRAEFWGAVEQHHKRGDAVVAREIVVALPAELDARQRSLLAMSYGRHLARCYGVAADVCIHAPGKGGDSRNHHAHILLSGCTVDYDGALGKKAVALDPIHCQRHKIPSAADEQRKDWEHCCNVALSRATGIDYRTRVDHRSLKAQGIDRTADAHLGPAATAIERRGRGESRIRQRHAARTAPERAERLDLERQIRVLAASAEGAEQALEQTRQQVLAERLDDLKAWQAGQAERDARERAAQAEREQAERERQRVAQERAAQAERERQRAGALASPLARISAALAQSGLAADARAAEAAKAGAEAAPTTTLGEIKAAHEQQRQQRQRRQDWDMER